jgi:hypothetical protein
VEWILKLAAAGDEGPRVDIMEISKPDALGDIANLGLTLTEAKQLLARVQREIWFCRKVRFVAEVGTNKRIIFSGLVFGSRNRKPTLRQNLRLRPSRASSRGGMSSGSMTSPAYVSAKSGEWSELQPRALGK